MARTYRFFLKHLVKEVLPVRVETPLRLTEKLEPDIFFQLVKVLRVSPGDKVVLLPMAVGEDLARGAADVGGAEGHNAETGGSGVEFEYEVESAQKKEVIMRFSARRKNENELPFKLGLLLCLPNKPDKLELILQKAVELGAAAVTLVEGDFSRMKHNLRADRLEKIMTEAAEQSERAIVPELMQKGKLRTYLEGLGDDEKARTLVAMERDAGTKSLQELVAGKKSANGITILIGPEGGFSPEEKALIEKLHLPRFTLGKRILRMETAAIVSLGTAATLRD